MAGPGSDANGAVETDEAYHSLATTDQQQSALTIKRRTGQFPWEIVPEQCTETNWTPYLLDKFVWYLDKLYPGEVLDDDQLGEWRTALSERLEPKGLDGRKILTADDARGAYNKLKSGREPESSNRRSSQRNRRRSSISRPMSATSTRRTSSTRKVNSANASGTKRSRVEQESPTHVMSTRSSKRMRPETPPNTTVPDPPKTPETSRMRSVRGLTEQEEDSVVVGSVVVDILDVDNGDEDKDDEESGGEDSDDKDDKDDKDDDETEDEVDAQDMQQSSAGQDHANDESTESHDAEETTLDSVTADTTESDPDQSSASPARTSQFAELSMTDEDIANGIRRYIGSIVHRQQSTAAVKLWRLKANHKGLKQAYIATTGGVNGARLDLTASKEALAVVSVRLETADSERENANQALAAIEKLTFKHPELSAGMQKTVERAQLSYRKALAEKETAFQEVTEAEKRVENAKKLSDDAKAKLDENERLIESLKAKEGGERQFKCIIRVETDARDEESGEKFPEFELKFNSIMRPGERSPS